MSKTSNPVLKEGLEIVARLVVIAMLLGVLGTVLQGCSSNNEASVKNIDHYSSITVTAEKPLDLVALELL